MIIGVSSTGKDMQSQIDPRFGRCSYFLIVQTDDMSFEVFKNENKSLGGGAGIQSATLLIEKGVKTLLTGSCGPNAMDVFNECGIQVITGQTGLIDDAIRKFKDNKTTETINTDDKNDVTKHHSEIGNYTPRGQGRCMGGAGRGMGRGQRAGRGMGGGMGNCRR